MSLTDAEIAARRGPFAGGPGHLDAPWQATPPAAVEMMLDLAEVGPGTHLLDLGCGDGRIVIAAAARGARASGIDIDPARIAAAEDAARKAGLAGTALFEAGDMFAADLGGIDVVTLFLLDHVNGWLEGKLRRELKPGARVVSYTFPMPAWQPTATAMHQHHTLYLWVR